MPGSGARPHPLTGRLAPDLRLANAGDSRVAELVRKARGLLLDLGRSGATVDSANDALSRAVSPWSDRVAVVAARPVVDPPPAGAMLIRPDGYVAWAAGPESVGQAQGLPEALRAWFGPPE
jgi:hypothetical protein